MAQRGMFTGDENAEHNKGYSGSTRKVPSAGKLADRPNGSNGVIGEPGNSPALRHLVRHEASMVGSLERKGNEGFNTQHLHDGHKKLPMPDAAGPGSPDTDYFRGEDREDY